MVVYDAAYVTQILCRAGNVAANDSNGTETGDRDSPDAQLLNETRDRSRGSTLDIQTLCTVEKRGMEWSDNAQYSLVDS